MKVLFDFNNLAMRTLHLPLVNAESLTPNFDFWAFRVFDIIHTFSVGCCAEFFKFGDTFEVIVAQDDKGDYWRKDIYPPYKADRKKKDTIDWPRVYLEMGFFLEDLTKFTPYQVLGAPRAEADDIIATLCRDADERGETCVVYSGDSDYIQLLSENVHVYSPNKEAYLKFPATVKFSGTKVTVRSVEEYLEYAVLTGQSGKDNVYNVKTPTDWEPTEQKKRKPPYGVKAAAKAIADGVEETMEKLGCQENYARNRELIDFAYIPEDICDTIREAYEAYEAPRPDMSGLLSRRAWPSYSAKKAGVEEFMCLMSGYSTTEVLEDMTQA